MKTIKIILVALLVTSCSEESTYTNKQTNILVLGNSITKHEPKGEWLGSWGMASSSPEKDFCAIINSSIKNSRVDRINIAWWENSLASDVSQIIPVTSISYDYVIFKIGENVDVSKNVEFQGKLKKLVNEIKPLTKKIIIVSQVWKEYYLDTQGVPQETVSKIDAALRNVAIETNSQYVDISDMSNYANNYAFDEYTDSQIACHPNDRGMRFIASAILNRLIINNE